MRVRQAQLGVGNVIAVKKHDDDRRYMSDGSINSVGVKTLWAKYAKLEPA